MAKEFFRQGEGLALILCGIVGSIEGKVPDEIMPDALLLFGGGSGGADGDVAIHLPAVGTDDGASEMLCDEERQLGLSHCRRTLQDVEGLHRVMSEFFGKLEAFGVDFRAVEAFIGEVGLSGRGGL